MRENKFPSELQILLRNTKTNLKEIPIPVGRYDKGCGIDAITAQKHMKLCLGAKIPYITISNGIPAAREIITNPIKNEFKTPISFIRCDISWYISQTESAKLYLHLLSSRINEFKEKYEYMLADPNGVPSNQNFTYNGNGKLYAAVQWAYSNIYSRLLYILILDFMNVVDKPFAENHLCNSIADLLPELQKRKK